MNAPDPMAETCRSWGVVDRPTLMAGTGPHACKAVCAHGGRFIKWISLLAPSERLARERVGRAQQLLTLAVQSEAADAQHDGSE